MKKMGIMLAALVITMFFVGAVAARKSKIDEDCEELSIVADPWNLELKPANPNFSITLFISQSE